MELKKIINILVFFTIMLFSCKSTEDEVKDFVESVNSHKTPLNLSNVGQERNLIYAEVISKNRIRMTCKTKLNSKLPPSSIVDIFSIPISMVLKGNTQTNDFINWGIEFDFVFLNEQGEIFTNLVFDKNLINDYLKDVDIKKPYNSMNNVLSGDTAARLK